METNYFTILYWFCHTSTWIHHRCICVTHLESPTHLPPCAIPLGHPSAPAPSILYPTLMDETGAYKSFKMHLLQFIFFCMNIFTNMPSSLFLHILLNYLSKYPISFGMQRHNIFKVWAGPLSTHCCLKIIYNELNLGNWFEHLNDEWVVGIILRHINQEWELMSFFSLLCL